MIPIIIACNIGIFLAWLLQKVVKATYRHRWAIALEQIAESQPRSETLLYCRYCGLSRYLASDHLSDCPVSIAREALSPTSLGKVIKEMSNDPLHH
jgi:hypothetical protein